jgi:hypothetical protein
LATRKQKLQFTGGKIKSNAPNSMCALLLMDIFLFFWTNKLEITKTEGKEQKDNYCQPTFRAPDLRENRQ